MSKILCKRIIMLTLLGCMAQSLQAVTLTVTSLSDSGSGSLRAILAKAHDGDTIVFARSLKNDGSAPLVLSSPISVNKNITIHGDVNGDKNTDITISGGGHTRLFEIESGSKVTLKFLHLIRGYKSSATGTISRMGETSTGGGIYNYGTLTMEYCRMSNHYASHGGGAILNNGGTLNIRGSTFSDNNGGAIYNGGGGKVYIRQSTFKNNVHDFGGAIDSFRSTLELSDSTLVSNRANLGSAIFSDGTTVIRNSTFYGNITPAHGHKINASASTVYGDNFTHNATIRLENTVIAGSTGKNCGGFGTYTIDHSWFDDDSCPNGVASGTGATLGTNSGNPELGSLQDNGGYTETMMPSGKSGLINAGNPQTCTVRDQRSAQRVGTCDIGAVEYGGSVSRTLTVTNDESSGSGSLRAILTEANDGDTIVFDPSLKNHTIFMLGSGHAPGPITLDKSVVINGDVDGDRKPDIILSGTGDHNTPARLLIVNQGETVTLEGLKLVHGFADHGGAIWNHGTLTINYCQLSYNTAKDGYDVSGFGGAIYNDSSGTLTINNTTLDHNTAMSAGGAIQNFKGKVMLMNVTLSDNAGDSSNEDVGAALDNMGGSMTLKNTTLYRTTGNGIGTYGSNEFASDTTLINTVIAGSSENNCAGYDGTYHVAGNNWFDDNTCGSSSSSGDPKLGGPLSTDSGWALNMPASNSGLIDAGDDDTCLPLDARGYRRPHGDHCDIGAVEVGATAPPDTDGDVDEVIDTSFRLNDTGITRGGDYVEGNNATCTSNITAPQDCHQGRDATHNDDSDGHAGFSFTKLDASGNQLPPGATSWSCVMDNVTGLIWEAKTDDGGIHDKDNTYRWGGKTAQGSGFGTYYNDWDSLVDGSNAEQLCGYDDWRVSSVDELLSLVNNDRTFPAIDTDYFPNTAIPYFFWSSSPYADDSVFAWYAYFSSGGANKSQRNHDLSVWLVHSRQ